MTSDRDAIETRARIERARTSAGAAALQQALPFSTFRDLLRARQDSGSAPYLVFYDAGNQRSEIAYDELLGRVAARARSLQSAGIGRGDRVGLLMHNDPEVPISCFAAWLLGATVVPANLGEDDERIAFVLENSGAKVVLHLGDYQHRVDAIRPTLPAVGGWLACPVREEPPARIEDFPATDPEDEALIVYTSGTTGVPKGVVLSQRNLLLDAFAMARWHGFDRDSRFMCVLPTHHVNGLVVTLVTPLSVGGRVVLNRRFRTGDFWLRAAAEGTHVISVVPTLLAFLLEDPAGFESVDVSALRYLICGAGPLTVDLAQRFEERFHVRILHGYGLSETTCYSCFLPTDLDDGDHAHWMRDFGFPSIGVPIEANEMAIHDPEGRALGNGERGEIVIRGVNVMQGYSRRPDANDEAFAHDWFRSGDEGFFERDPSGRAFFFITGRIKELIIRGGVNISPFEIDEVLNRVPGIARGLAVGFENEWYGEEVGAYVMLEEGSPLCERDILAACRETLAFAKSPKVVLFGDDIPVTSTGKYQRGKLAPLFAEHRRTQFRL